MITVAAYTGGLNVPSARYRVRQLIPLMQEKGVTVKEFPAPLTSYPPARPLIRPLWAAAAITSRIPAVMSGYHFDITFLQREMLSTFVTLEPFTRKPRVLDVDDAIFLHRKGKTAHRLAELSDQIICGNDFLAEHFRAWNSRISVIPTAVDTSHYIPADSKKPAQNIIGWMGSSSNFKYLYQISAALEKLIQDRKETIFRVISDKRPIFNNKLDGLLHYVPWTADQEIRQLQEMTVGIMPLADGEWERGKCSFKMLQYMACGIPVVVSPVGMNQQVLSMGQSGFAATSQDDWIDALTLLLDDETLCRDLGVNGRNVVEKNFSHTFVAKQLAESLKNLV